MCLGMWENLETGAFRNQLIAALNFCECRLPVFYSFAHFVNVMCYSKGFSTDLGKGTEQNEADLLN